MAGEGRKMEMKTDELSSPSMMPEDEVGGAGLGSAVEAVGGDIESPAADVLAEEKSLDHVHDQAQYQDQNSSGGDVAGEIATLYEVKNGAARDGDGEGRSEAVLEQASVEGEEIELPVLKDTGDVGAEEGSRNEMKVLRSEIPDSEADTEEAVSPVKGSAVDSRVQAPDMDGQNSPSAEDSGLMAGTLSDKDEDQDIEIATIAAGMEVDVSPAPSNEQPTQHPENEVLPTNTVHEDSDAVSFVDNESMIILPQFTTSGLQSTHTQNQTQTQEEEDVKSHFADAVAVMSDLGGGTQDLMSSVEEVGAKGGEVVMHLSDEVANGTQSTGEREGVDEVVKLDGIVAEHDGLPGPHLRENIPLDKAVEESIEPVSSLDQQAVPDASAKELPPADRGNESALMGEDTAMSDEPLQHQQTEAKEDFIPTANEVDTVDVEKHSHDPDVKAAAIPTARSVPDSDDDEELPDAEPVSKAQEKISTKSTAPMSSQPTTGKPAEPNEKDTQTTDHSSSPETSTKSKPPPPKMPNASFKAPTLSTTIESQSTEPTSSPSKSEVTTSTPSKSKMEKEKTPSKSFTASDVSQNKDILMAELKAIKIASIQARNASLEAEIKKKKARLEEVTKELNYPAAETVKNHIKLLHDYNDIRDVGQGLVGMIADNRGVRIGELYEEFGVGLKD